MAALPKPFQKMRKGLGKEVELRSHCLSLRWSRTCGSWLSISAAYGHFQVA